VHPHDGGAGRGGIAAFKIIPVRVRAAEVKEAVKRAAELAATDSHYKNENVVASILECARENELPINEKQIKIDRAAREVHVEVNYQVTVDIVRYKYTMTFSPLTTPRDSISGDERLFTIGEVGRTLNIPVTTLRFMKRSSLPC